MIAESYLPLLCNVLHHDLDALAAAALSAMLDLLLIFRDTAPWNTPPTTFVKTAADGQQAAAGLFQTSFSALAHPSAAVRGVAAEGVAKLLTAGRFRGAAEAAEGDALAAAVLLHFAEDVDSAGEPAKETLGMQQCLAVFFAGFARQHPSNAAAIGRAVVPAMRCVMHAPAGSRLSRVGATHLGQYLLSLLEPPEATTGGPDEAAAAATAAAPDAAYAAAAAELLLELEASVDDDAAVGRHLSKVLHAIPLVALVSGRSAGYCSVLKLAERVLGAAKDAATRTALAKFIKAVGDAADAADPESERAVRPLPEPTMTAEHEERVRRAVQGPVAELFNPPGAAAATPVRARKPSAGGTAQRKKKAAARSAAASPASSDGEAPALRRSTR